MWSDEGRAGPGRVLGARAKRRPKKAQERVGGTENREGRRAQLCISGGSAKDELRSSHIDSNVREDKIMEHRLHRIVATIVIPCCDVLSNYGGVQFNTFHNFYHLIKDYNNNFNIIVDNYETVLFSIPEGNINAYTIRDDINNHESLQNHIKVPTLKP